MQFTILHWVQLRADLIVAVKKIILRDENPSLNTDKRMITYDGLEPEKRWKRLSTAVDMTEEDGHNFLVEEDEVFHPMPHADGWEDEDKADEEQETSEPEPRPGPSTRKPGYKKKRFSRS